MPRLQVAFYPTSPKSKRLRERIWIQINKLVHNFLVYFHNHG